MATYNNPSAASFDNRDLWIDNTEQSTGETFSGQISSSGSFLSGQADATYSEYTFTAGGLTYRYIGNFTAEFNGGLLSGTISASGSYNQIIVMDGDEVIANYAGKPTAVDFGSQPTGVLGLVPNLLGLVGGLLNGPGAQSVANLHLDATPNLPAVAFAGNDRLTGGEGVDHLFGYAGKDVIIGGHGADIIDGGTGVDVLSYITSASKVRVVLETGQASYGDAQGDTFTGIENLRGSKYNDTLAGDAGKNELRGENGNDLLQGREGNDRLIGGAGEDLIDGGLGTDVLYGGLGSDTFHFSSVLDSYSPDGIRDTIRDFSSADGDKIDLVDVDRNDHLDFIGGSKFTGAGDEVRFQKYLHDTVVFVDLDGDKVADFSIKLSGVDSVSASDFML